MAQCKKCLVEDVINNEIIKFYARYVDDTLLLVKRKNNNDILGRFNSFLPNLQFTVDTFENVLYFIKTVYVFLTKILRLNGMFMQINTNHGNGNVRALKLFQSKLRRFAHHLEQQKKNSKSSKTMQLGMASLRKSYILL